jgi:GTP-binding protein HflX
MELNSQKTIRTAIPPAIAQRLPRPAVDLRVLLPYDRGDLVARIHRAGQVLNTRYTDEGTELQVRVDERLAAELESFRDGEWAR